MQEHLAIFYRLADDAVQRLNGIGGVIHLADIVRIIEQRNQVRPVAPPALTNGRNFLVPGFGKSSLWVANSYSCSNRSLKKSVAMGYP